jgi:16S rRNA (uracil1498-N3)-methyltransferase
MGCRLHVPPPLVRGELTIAGEDHHYLFRVRRLRAGDPVVLFDGAGHQAEAVVVSIGADQARVEVGAIAAEPPARGSRLIVLQSLIKNERMDWCVQKLVELGVQAIVPVAAARSVVKLDAARAARRVERLTAIARDAARQSGRATVTEIGAVRPLAEAVAEAAGSSLKLLFWARAREMSLRDALPATPPAEIAFLVGPEGGFEPAEVDRARAAGFRPVGLGPRTLRAETAAVAAAAALGFALGDLG